MKNRLGFTLIELMVAISIIAVLMAIGVVSYVQANRNARNARRAADMEQVRSALEMYRNENPTYPATTSWSNLMSTLSDYLSQSSQIADPRGGDDFAYSYNDPAPGTGAASECSAYSLCYQEEQADGSAAVTKCVCNP